MLKEFSLDKRCAIVTGGSKGLGFAMARALANAGADVAITSRHRDELQDAATRLQRETGKKFHAIVSDVTHSDQAQDTADDALRHLGRLDILVNNAGLNIRKPALEQTEEEFRQIVDTNLVGAFEVAKAVGKHLIAQKSGSIINVASMIGMVGLPGRAGYTSSKGGLIQLTRTLALEWAQYNVRVNTLCPGPFITPMNMPVLDDPEVKKEFISRIPLGRWGRPEELGPAIVFLASEASSFMTGATLTIDGGWTAQ
jgi:NAD(P)-dependent dehydrogenase (short-subunit alcohol dehydrogenase family)